MQRLHSSLFSNSPSLPHCNGALHPSPTPIRRKLARYGKYNTYTKIFFTHYFRSFKTWTRLRTRCSFHFCFLVFALLFTMLEADESYMSGMIAEQFSNSLHDDDREVLNLWADASVSESDRSLKGSRFRENHVLTINYTCTWKRGQRHSHKPLYPPHLKTSQIPILSAQRRLIGVDYAARIVILNLESCWMQVSYVSDLFNF